MKKVASPGRNVPRQPHHVVNANRRSRRGLKPSDPPIIVSQAGENSLHSHELDGRLRVVTKRPFQVKVSKFEASEPEGILKEAHNPMNQLGALHEESVPVVTSPDYHSFLAAFNKRCNFKQAGPDDDIGEAEFQEALAIINEAPDVIFDAWDENEHDRERWLSKFDPHKQKRMRDAFADLPNHSAKMLGKKDLSVKAETLAGKRDESDWAARVIYAGTDAYNACTGPAAMVSMEKLVEWSVHSKIGDIKVRFAYKQNDVKLCEHLIDPAYPCVIEGDFSRNDREQRSRVALLYDAFLAKVKMPAWYRDLLLAHQTFSVVNYRYGVFAEISFQLPTGATTTTPRNSLYNAVMFAVVARRQKRRGKAVILGDDILACLNKRLDIKAWVRDVALFKMVLKAKEPRLDGEATLLSRRIFTEVDVPCMVPLLGKMLVRFNARATFNEGVSDSQYMAGKALSYAYECRHVPTLSSIFLERFQMEDSTNLQHDDLSWFTRTSDVPIEQMLDFIKNEKVLVDRDSFDFWLCEHYDIDMFDTVQIFRETILESRPIMLENPDIAKFLARDGI